MGNSGEVKQTLKEVRKIVRDIQFRLVHSAEEQEHDVSMMEREGGGYSETRARETPYPHTWDIYHDCMRAWSLLPDDTQSEKLAKDILGFLTVLTPRMQNFFKKRTIEDLINRQPLKEPVTINWSPLKYYFAAHYFQSINDDVNYKIFMDKALELDPNFVAPENPHK